MNDPLLVGMVDPIANLPEKPESLRRGQAIVIAISGYRNAWDVFEDEVGPPLTGGSGIEDLSDVRMVHEGEGLAFRLEAREDVFEVHARLQHLESDASSNGPVLVRQIDHAEPTTTQLFHESIGVDLTADFDVLLMGPIDGIERKGRIRVRIRHGLPDGGSKPTRRCPRRLETDPANKHSQVSMARVV